MPALEEGNKDISFIYTIVRSQYIMGFGGPIAVNQLTVWKALREYKIKNRTKVFEGVIKLSDHMISLERKRAE